MLAGQAAVQIYCTVIIGVVHCQHLLIFAAPAIVCTASRVAGSLLQASVPLLSCMCFWSTRESDNGISATMSLTCRLRTITACRPDLTSLTAVCSC